MAVDSQGVVFSSRGRCQELLYQVDKKDLDTEVILGPERSIRLADLLPHWWQDLVFQLYRMK